MSLFQRSEVTSAIVRYLAQSDKGAHVPYDELSSSVGYTITPISGQLMQARRILERDHAQIWVCVRPGVGLLRLDDTGIVDHQRGWWLKGARNKLTSASRQADAVELSGLDISKQAQFATDSIIREIALDSLSRATQRKIEKTARGNANDLPSFNAVEWMISLSPRRSGSAK